MKIINSLPNIYFNILPAVFHEEIDEKTVDCANCMMLKENGANDIKHFLPTTKCCGYYPHIINYFAGAILSDTSPQAEEGQKVIRKMIEKRVGVLPEGLMTPTMFKTIYFNSEKTFGRAESLKCMFYNSEQNICNIWKYRSATCSHWQCYYYHGVEGKKLWNSIGNYLRYVEKTLYIYAMLDNNLNVDNISNPLILDTKQDYFGNTKKLSPEDIDEYVSDEHFNKIWSFNKTTIENYYISCYQSVKKLSKEKFLEISGIHQTFLRYKIESAIDKISNVSLPLYLTKNPKLTIYKISDNTYSIYLQHNYGAYNISKPTYSALDYFDGHLDNNLVIKKVHDELGFIINADLLKELYHHRILQ